MLPLRPYQIPNNEPLSALVVNFRSAFNWRQLRFQLLGTSTHERKGGLEKTGVLTKMNEKGLLTTK